MASTTKVNAHLPFFLSKPMNRSSTGDVNDSAAPVRLLLNPNVHQNSYRIAEATSV